LKQYCETMAEKKSFPTSVALIVAAAVAAFIFSTTGSVDFEEGFKTDQATGFSFPLQHNFQVAGKKLELLGLGTRRKAIINVYSVAFYGSKPVVKALAKNKDEKTKCETIVESKGTKAAFLTMNMGLNADKMAEALSNIAGVKEKTKQEFGEMILTGIGGKLERGESMTIEWKPPHLVAISARGKLLGDVKDKNMYDGLLKAYLGPKAVSPALKKDIQGGSAKA